MLASSTVENYLKAIYQGVGALTPPVRLLPMGQLANALGVAPGTATTMIKTLAESGLVEYEPYAGVTLTPSGRKLAALVLRRHRLVELFLVRVMGYSWDEVHEEAEHLEHVVSDRLIDRIDEMLGRPEVDPHGDPIPDADGLVKAQEAQTLLTCPTNVTVTVMRVIDQDKTFLRFIEQHNLKPGEPIEVEDRDAASDSVRVKGKDDRRVTIGTKAASKLLVAVTALVVFASLGTNAWAQPASPPFEITDNSFLVEEAFNQEAGIFQNIVGVRANRGAWLAGFTQEWPLGSQAHQISYTVNAASSGSLRGFSDIAVHYRFQLRNEREGQPAVSPRLTLLIPSGSDNFSSGSFGYEVNLPLSKQLGELYVHGNAGLTHYPELDAITPRVAGSAIVRVRPMLNLMLESVVEFLDLGGTRPVFVTVAPGVRFGWDSGDKQTIVGIAVPVTRGLESTDVSAFGYLSYELPFAR
jgi:DtxR family Mn-dependent transcriptional regulator